jgi:hypothetical protein
VSSPSFGNRLWIVGVGGFMMAAPAAYQYLCTEVMPLAPLVTALGSVLVVGAAVMPCLIARPTPVLQAQLVSLSFNNTIRVSRNAVEAVAPQWEAGRGDTRPVVFQRSEVDAAYVDADIDITQSRGQPGTGTLKSTFHDLQLECLNCPLTVGRHTCKVRISKLPSAIGVFRGTTGKWVLTGASSCNLGKAALVIYVILKAPGFSFNSVVWAEALDFLCDRVGLQGYTDEKLAVGTITQYCHSGHGLTYESANHYAYSDRGGRFCLEAYMATTDPFANCYDQASAIQVFGHAIGCDVQFKYLSTFGFISLTNLMGVPGCNNPGYRLTGEAVRLDDPSCRTPFVDHACCVLNDLVFDACIGPELGDRTIEGYLASAIDDSVSEAAYVRPRVDKDKRLDGVLKRATLRDVKDGGVIVLNRGPAGQVSRRLLSTEIEQQGVREKLMKLVSAYNLCALSRLLPSAETPGIEQILEEQFVDRLRREPDLAPGDAVEQWNQDDGYVDVALEHLNRQTDQTVGRPQLLDKQRESDLLEERKEESRDEKARTKQIEDRKSYVQMQMGSAAEYDQMQRDLGYPIYKYNPITDL